MNRPTRSQVNERRRLVAQYALDGWTQAAIARHMNIPAATVSRDLTAVQETCREFPIGDIEQSRIEQLQKIDLVETEAWAAWQRSQEPQQVTKLSDTGAVATVRIKQGSGDPLYLRIVLRCIALRCALIGLKPLEAPANEVNIPLMEEQPREAEQDYVVLRESSGEPSYSPGELRPAARIPATLS
jgi:hypothetical protein